MELAGVHTVPFNIGEFLSGTMGMSTLEKGAYIMLLLAHYQKGGQGLPDNDDQLARICGVYPKTWRSMRDIMITKFTIIDGYWRHEKVLDVLKNIHTHSNRQRAKALKRHGADNAVAQPQHSHTKTKTKKDTSVSRTDTDLKSEISLSNNQSKTQSKFAPPIWVRAEVWASFEEMRKKIKRPMTDRARELTISTLSKLRIEGNDPNEVLEQSVQNSWQGVFALKHDWRVKSQQKKSHMDGMMEAAARGAMDAERSKS